MERQLTTHIVRRADGSVDINYYTAEARQARREAIADFFNRHLVWRRPVQEKQHERTASQPFARSLYMAGGV